MTKCRSCGANIVWLLTAKGKRMPVDAETAQPADRTFDHHRHTSHFATCPNAADHRKHTSLADAMRAKDDIERIKREAGNDNT